MKYNIYVKDKIFICSDGKNIMDSLSSKCNIVPKGCHNGGCGVCKIKIHSGEYKLTKMSRRHISVEDESKGVVLACRVFPQSDISFEFISQPKSIVYKLGSSN